MSLNTIGKRILKLRKKTSRKAFAEALEVGVTTLQRYENDERSPDFDFALRIQKLTGCDINWLITGKMGDGAHKEKIKENKNKSIKNKTGDGAHFDSRKELPINPDDYAWIPLYNVEVSAGNGRFFENENIITHLSFSKYSLGKRSLAPNKLGFVIVHGDSMQPTLEPNDCILVDFEKRNPDGGVFVLRVGDAMHVKRLILEKDSIRVISDNDRYREWSLDKNDDFEIIGKFCWVGRYAV